MAINTIRNEYQQAISPELFRKIPKAVLTGLTIMAEKYPKHWADFLEEDGDNDTADVFIQCCVLGDVVYG